MRLGGRIQAAAEVLEDVIERRTPVTMALRDWGKAHRFARSVRAGTVWVNTYNRYDPGSPFGGFKQSGFGRDLGERALEEYTQTKSVWVALD